MTIYIHTSKALLFSSLLLASLNVLAEQKESALAQQKESAATLEEVIVFSHRIPTSLADAPANLAAITEENIEATNAIHIHELISQVPGVNFQRGDGQESLPGIRSAVLTGAGACGNVLVLEEGIPVRGTAFCNVNELFDTHFEHASQVEIIRGPGSVIYGGNSLNGSINVSLADRGTDVFQLDIGEDEYVRAKAALSYGGESQYGRVYASLTDADSFREESGFNQQKLSLRHFAKLADWNLNAGATYTRLDQETAGFLVGTDAYLDADRISENPNPEAFRQSESFRAWAKFSKTYNDGSTLAITPFVRSTDMSFLLHFLPGQPLEENEHSSLGLQAVYSKNTDSSLQWSLGVDADVSNGSLLQVQNEATEGSAFLQETIPTGTQYDYEVDALQLAAFGQLTWQVNDRLALVSGLRVESLDFDYDNLSLDGRTRDDGTECGFGGCRYSRPADRQDSFFDVSPRLELKYAVNDNFQLHASASNSFRAPQATELYRLQGAQEVASIDSVNASSFELGANYITQGLKIGASIYSLDQRNVIIRDSDSFNIDGNSTDSQGFEFSIQQRLNDSWSWQAAWSIAEHRYSSDQFIGDLNINGNEIDTAPRSVGNASLNWSPTRKISTALSFQHVDNYFTNAENTNEYPGHTVWDLRVQYALSESLTTSVRIDNVTDELYAERADFTGFTGERFFPGRPRAFTFSIEYRL